MKRKIILLLFTSILFCKTTYGQTGGKKVKARLIVCSGLSEKNVPLDDLKEIFVKKGEKVILYVKWFNLKNKNYVTSMDFLDSNGNYLAQSSGFKFKPKKKTLNTSTSRKFNKVIVPEGVIKIRINLDEEIILERKIEIKYKSE